MLGPGHGGVGEIAQGVDALYAFAATTSIVPNHLFDIAHDALIADEAVLARTIAANPAAAAAIASRLRDALARGLWVARRNAVAGELDRAIARTQHARGAPLEAAKCSMSVRSRGNWRDCWPPKVRSGLCHPSLVLSLMVAGV